MLFVKLGGIDRGLLLTSLGKLTPCALDRLPFHQEALLLLFVLKDDKNTLSNRNDVGIQGVLEVAGKLRLRVILLKGVDAGNDAVFVGREFFKDRLARYHPQR